jgi:hypothetical protein
MGAGPPSEEITPEAEQAFLRTIASLERSTPRARQRVRLGIRGGTGLRPGLKFAIAAGLSATLIAGFLTIGARAPDRSAVKPLKMTELAYRASAAALRGRDISPNQWVYRKLESYGGIGLADPRGVHTTDATWTTANGLDCAMWTQGKLELSGRECGGASVSYAQLNSLPSDPTAIDRYLTQPKSTSEYGPGASTAQATVWAFDEIGQILSNYVLQPKLTATLYRALADLRGVTVLNNAHTAAGQTGVAFVLPAPPDTGTVHGLPDQEIILDPTSYKLIGWTEINKAGDPAHGVPAGNVQATSVLKEAFVSGPAVQP